MLVIFNNENLLIHTFIFAKFCLLSQEWNRLNNLPLSARNNPVSFVVGDSAYIGTGYDGLNLFDDLWKK